jgi:hypothetical protein
MYAICLSLVLLKYFFDIDLLTSTLKDEKRYRADFYGSLGRAELVDQHTAPRATYCLNQ